MAKQKSVVTEYRSYFLPLDFPVLLLSGDHWKISDVPSGRLHFHNCLEIGICHSDSGTLEIYNQKMRFKEGDVTCIPKNVPHTTYSDKGTESHWSYLFLDPSELLKGILPASISESAIMIQPNEGFMPILTQENDPTINMLLLSIIKELEEKKPGYQLVARGLLPSLYVTIRRIQSENVKEKETSFEGPPENFLVLQPVLDYIDKNYMDYFSMESLADICHLSPTHFRRIFHSVMGTSPLDYLNNIRIIKSCNLLRSTEDSILDISEAVGFRSISSYNRCFTQLLHLNPRAYRIQMQQADKRNEKQIIMEFTGWMSPETFDE